MLKKFYKICCQDNSKMIFKKREKIFLIIFFLYIHIKMHVDEHFFDTIKTLFILLRLSFTFAVNFIKGEIFFPIQHFILSTWYHEYIEI